MTQTAIIVIIANAIDPIAWAQPVPDEIRKRVNNIYTRESGMNLQSGLPTRARARPIHKKKSALRSTYTRRQDDQSILVIIRTPSLTEEARIAAAQITETLGDLLEEYERSFQGPQTVRIGQ